MVKAPIGKRIIAYILDIVIITVILVAVYIGIMILGVILGYVSQTLQGFTMLLMIPAAFLPLVYLLIRDGLGSGRSLGKKFMKLKVEKEGGAKCGIVDSVLRNIVAMVPVIGIIDVIMPFIDADGKRIGDKIAKTQVVEA